MYLWLNLTDQLGAADLAGTTSGSEGDWITGTDFPIIDDASLAGPYALAYYPTIYSVCANRQLTEVGAISASAHYANVGSCVSASGTNNGGLLSYDGETSSCSAIDVIVTLQNLGTGSINCSYY